MSSQVFLFKLTKVSLVLQKRFFLSFPRLFFYIMYSSFNYHTVILDSFLTFFYFSNISTLYEIFVVLITFTTSVSISILTTYPKSLVFLFCLFCFYKFSNIFHQFDLLSLLQQLYLYQLKDFFSCLIYFVFFISLYK